MAVTDKYRMHWQGLDLGVEPPHIKHFCYVRKYPETRNLWKFSNVIGILKVVEKWESLWEKSWGLKEFTGVQSFLINPYICLLYKGEGRSWTPILWWRCWSSSLLRDTFFLADIALGLLKWKLNDNKGVEVQLRGPLHCVARKCKYFSQCQPFVCLGIVTQKTRF